MLTIYKAQCPELEMNKIFESPRRDHCREVRHVSEIPKTNSRKLCVIGTPMLILKKRKKIGQSYWQRLTINKSECLRSNQILPFNFSPILKTLALKISCLIHTSLFWYVNKSQRKNTIHYFFKSPSLFCFLAVTLTLYYVKFWLSLKM